MSDSSNPAPDEIVSLTSARLRTRRGPEPRRDRRWTARRAGAQAQPAPRSTRSRCASSGCRWIPRSAPRRPSSGSSPATTPTSATSASPPDPAPAPSTYVPAGNETSRAHRPGARRDPVPPRRPDRRPRGRRPRRRVGRLELIALGEMTVRGSADSPEISITRRRKGHTPQVRVGVAGVPVPISPKVTLPPTGMAPFQLTLRTVTEDPVPDAVPFHTWPTV